MEKSSSIELDCTRKCRNVESTCAAEGEHSRDQCQNLYNQCVQKCAFA
jgi:hypothetical protein